MWLNASTVKVHLPSRWWYREASFFEPGQIVFSHASDVGHFLEGGGSLWASIGLDFDLHSHQQITHNMVDISSFLVNVGFNIEGMVVFPLGRYIFNKVYFISISGFLLHRIEAFKDDDEMMSI